VKTVIKIRHLKICRNSLVCLFQHRRQWAQSHMSSKRHNVPLVQISWSFRPTLKMQQRASHRKQYLFQSKRMLWMFSHAMDVFTHAPALLYATVT